MRRFLVLVGVALAVLVVPAMALPPGESALVNRAPDGTHGGTFPTFDVSSDGRCVAFVSSAAALPGANGSPQVYVRDTVAGTTTLVSATPGGAGGDEQSSLPDITPDCRYVAFDSDASDLTATPLDQRLVYRRDLLTGTTILISRATGASGAIPDRGAFSASISDDGTRIAFATAASNLAPDDDDRVLHTDIFLRRVDTAATTNVSRNGAGEAQDGSRGAGFYPSLSGDGTRVAFDSDADNLSGDDASGQDVFVKTLATGALALASRATGASGAGGNSGSGGPEMSADGRRVVFVSAAGNLTGGPPTGALSTQAYVRDLVAGQTFLASIDAAGNRADADVGGSDSLGISRDGNRVVFYSQATNLAGGGGDGDAYDVFIHDHTTGTTEAATPAASSVFSALAPDGEHVAFETDDGLAGDDTDGEFDLYLHHFVPGGGPGPTPTPTPTATPTATATASPTPTPAPPPAVQTIRGAQAFVQGTANDLYLACTKLDLYLVDVLPAGRRVSVTGAADLRLAGQAVDILLDGRKVGGAVIGAGGAFAAKVRAPARGKRARARYQAKVGATVSQRLRLVRRMVATTLTRSGKKLVLRGIVNPPRARRQPAIKVDRFLSCRRRQAVKVPRVRPDRRGRFAIRIAVPSGPRAVLYRARTKVPSGPRRPATKGTFTLPRAADVR